MPSTARHLHAVPTPQDDTGHDDAPDDALGGGGGEWVVRHDRTTVDYTVPAACITIIAVCVFGTVLVLAGMLRGWW